MNHPVRSYFFPHTGSNCDTVATTSADEGDMSYLFPDTGNKYDTGGWGR